MIGKELFLTSKNKPRYLNQKFGYGISLGSTYEWDGKTNSFCQYLPELAKDLATQDIGESIDVSQFYLKNRNVINGSKFNRFQFRFLISGANEKIESLWTKH